MSAVSSRATRRWARPPMHSTAASCVPGATPPMTDSDRAKIVQTLSGRHEELLTELDSLEKQIETALAATRPPSPPSPPVPTAVATAA